MHRATFTFGLYYDSDQDLLFSGLSLEAGPSLLTGHIHMTANFESI